jgi:hypothetical protein
MAAVDAEIYCLRPLNGASDGAFVDDDDDDDNDDDDDVQ